MIEFVYSSPLTGEFVVLTILVVGCLASAGVGLLERSAIAGIIAVFSAMLVVAVGLGGGPVMYHDAVAIEQPDVEGIEQIEPVTYDEQTDRATELRMHVEYSAFSSVSVVDGNGELIEHISVDKGQNAVVVDIGEELDSEVGEFTFRVLDGDGKIIDDDTVTATYTRQAYGPL